MLTVAQYAATWIEQRGLKARTKEHYRSVLAHHVSPALGNVALKTLSPQAVRAWYAAMNPDHPTIRAHA